MRPDTDADFVAEAGKVILRSKRKRHDPLDEWLGEMTGVARGKTTTAKVMKLTRG